MHVFQNVTIMGVAKYYDTLVRTTDFEFIIMNLIFLISNIDLNCNTIQPTPSITKTV